MRLRECCPLKRGRVKVKFSKSSTLPAMCMESPYYCQRFASPMVEIYVNVNKRPWQYLKDILWPSDDKSFMIDHHFSPSQPAFSFGSADFPNCSKGSVVHWSRQLLLWAGIHRKQYTGNNPLFYIYWCRCAVDWNKKNIEYFTHNKMCK